MKLTLTTFLTLDGVMQAPGAPDEDRTGGFAHGGWLMPYADDDMGALVVDWFAKADAFLLGRRTYDIFAAHWPYVGGEDPIAAALNTLPKHVVSSAPGAPAWHNAERVTLDDVASLKARPGRELQVHGSGQLARTLMARGLIDEYRLLVFPVVLGTGRRFFEEPDQLAALRLTGTKTARSGMVAHTYEPDGAPRYGSAALTG
ncbi:dihydrofolate reductase family protein [Amycolatopsis sp. H20-H5]|uniref:dihydrofolate reductase family protein n=1 Tax=Amycolatopsis sp. H20-H5 TaxID=3046309 RepID=UPI002DBA709E|nr:dihydrofolate reductase family protein [Amycolatopsis sp. H20-H5]MEC3981116.1 dihydrofolate reductase family protein [Amycolatopsis sp. H20-H5]